MSEAGAKADFSGLRYAQCWEDADVLVEALRPRPGADCLSIASAGDNSLALLASDPQHVTAVDLSPAQLAAVELRVAAYRRLEHGELLQLVGSRPGDRWPLYRRLRGDLGPFAQRFWDERPGAVAAGVGGAGRFEAYFALFRRRVLPLVHGRATVRRLVEPRSRAGREAFYDEVWDGWRWRLLFRLFFSRVVMGRLGRDPRFFDHVEGPVADAILARTRHALTVLEPAENPYLHWILTGTHGEALPLALREASFGRIRENLDRFTWKQESLESFVAGRPGGSLDACNLSDIFEYMSPAAYHASLDRLADATRGGGRLAYWNMLAPRRRPEAMADRLRSLDGLSSRLHGQDKAFFYSAFVVEEAT